MKAKINGKQIGIVTAMCGMAAAGIGMTLNTAGLFYTAAARALGCGKGAVSFTTTIMSMLSALTGLFTARLIRRYGVRKICRMAAGLLTAGTFLCAAARNLIFLYICCIFRGIGSGLAGYVTVTMVLSRWFNEKRGFVTGLALAFSGLPGVLFSGYLTHQVETAGWRTGYVSTGVLTVLFCVPSLILPVSLNPQTVGTEPYGKAQTEKKTEAAVRFSYRSPAFVLCLTASIVLYMLVSFSNHLPSYAVSIKQSAEAGALMLSTAMACNILSKVLYGELADHFGWFAAFILSNGLTLAGLFGLYFSRSAVILSVSAGLFAFTFSVSGIGISLAIQDLFGLENYGHVYPAVNLAGGVCNALAAALAGTVYDICGSYQPDLLAGMVFVLFSTVCFGLSRQAARQRK